MADTDQVLWKVKIKLCEQSSCLLSMAVQDELPGWMHRALGEKPYTAALSGSDEYNCSGDEEPSQIL